MATPLPGVAINVYHVWWDPKLAGQVARAGRQNRIFGFHVIDIPRIRSMVEAAGYSGTVEVEIFSAADWWQRPVGETLSICAERLQTVC
jgi:sugar phosphate isomerase/epimerase